MELERDLEGTSCRARGKDSQEAEGPMSRRWTYGRHKWQWAEKKLRGGTIDSEPEGDVQEVRGAMSQKEMYGRHKWQ